MSDFYSKLFICLFFFLSGGGKQTELPSIWWNLGVPAATVYILE